MGQVGGEDEFEFSESYPNTNMSFADVTETKEVITESSSTKAEEIIAKKRQKATPHSKNEELPPLDDVINTWGEKGHQDNHSQLYVCKALADGDSVAAIARIIRMEVYSTTNIPLEWHWHW